MLRFAARSSFRLISSKTVNIYAGSKHVLYSQHNAPKYSTDGSKSMEDDLRKLVSSEMIKLLASNYWRTGNSLSPFPSESEEGKEKYNLVRGLMEEDYLWMTHMTLLEKEITRKIHSGEDSTEYANFLAFISNRRSLVMLGPTLFLRFRITARKVLEKHLSKKIISKVLEEDKGSNFVKNHKNVDRIVDYNFFLEQLGGDIKSGHLDAFFGKNELNFVDEFYEICEYALFGERKLYCSARPNDIFYIQEEISCDIEFPAQLDKVFLCCHIDKIICKTTQQKCRRILFYLEKLIAISKIH